MEIRYKKLRAELDQLGYRHPLSVDAIPLVEKLMTDLVHTTENLRKYMKIAQEAVEERDILKFGAEPYKCDNAKLVKECNDLHLTFLQYREQTEKQQREMKRKFAMLERQKADIEESYDQLKTRLSQAELQLTLKSEQLIGCKCRPKFGSKMQPKSALKTCSTTTSLRSKSGVQKSTGNFELSSAMALAEEKIASLSKEVRRLRDEQLDLTEINSSMVEQLKRRDQEIERLKELLEGGRPITALNMDCCYKDVDGKMYRMQEEILNLQKSRSDMEERLKEAIAKQHEAMKRALQLADRNKLLEKEMRDIDQIALAVEAECNSNARSNAEKLRILEDNVNEYTMRITALERQNAELKRDKEQLMGDLDAVKTEKRHLQSVLETALDDKKRLNNRINQLTIIENDLNMEIDRLVQLTTSQKRRIAELECNKIDEKVEGLKGDATPSKQKKKGKGSPSPKKGGAKGRKKSPPPRGGKTGKNISNKKTARESPEPPPSESDVEDLPRNTPKSTVSGNENGLDTLRQSLRSGATCANPEVCLEHMKALLDKHLNQSGCKCSFEHVFAEKDYYMKECHRLQDELMRQPSNRQEANELAQRLSEKEQQIMLLQHENRSLSQEKHGLMMRLESSRDNIEPPDLNGLSSRSVMKRFERENELLKQDIQRLEEERDALRNRVKAMNEDISQNHARMQRNVDEYEEQIRKLETERRDLMTNQGSRRAAINNLEEQCDHLQQQLKLSQSDLAHQRALYTQIKSLQEQTDRALGDSQGQVIQLEKELQRSCEKCKELEHTITHLKDELNASKEDIAIMRGNLSKIDSDKDAILITLDDKTERVVALEQELRNRETKISMLEMQIAEMKGKLSKNIDETSSKDYLLRNLQTDTTSLRSELDSAVRAKDLALQENRRLQEELAVCTADCRSKQNDLDIMKRQVDDLRRQLQHYVAEIKRTEDLISQKEIERSDMLEQFKTLSQEANHLENNNHTLENEAAQSRIQLSAALSHTADLEHRLENQDAIVNGYEKQISELTAQVASLEIQLKQSTKIQDQLEAELTSTRDLCLKLDKQKDSLMRELQEKEHMASRMDRDVSKLRRESSALQDSLQRDKSNAEQLEKLLAECRRENTNIKMEMEDMQEEVRKNKAKIIELQTKLDDCENGGNNLTDPSKYVFPGSRRIYDSGPFDECPKSADEPSRPYFGGATSRTSRRTLQSNSQFPNSRYRSRNQYDDSVQLRSNLRSKDGDTYSRQLSIRDDNIWSKPSQKIADGYSNSERPTEEFRGSRITFNGEGSGAERYSRTSQRVIDDGGYSRTRQSGYSRTSQKELKTGDDGGYSRMSQKQITGEDSGYSRMSQKQITGEDSGYSRMSQRNGGSYARASQRQITGEDGGYSRMSQRDGGSYSRTSQRQITGDDGGYSRMSQRDDGGYSRTSQQRDLPTGDDAGIRMSQRDVRNSRSSQKRISDQNRFNVDDEPLRPRTSQTRSVNDSVARSANQQIDDDIDIVLGRSRSSRASKQSQSTRDFIQNTLGSVLRHAFDNAEEDNQRFSSSSKLSQAVNNERNSNAAMADALGLAMRSLISGNPEEKTSRSSQTTASGFIRSLMSSAFNRAAEKRGPSLPKISEESESSVRDESIVNSILSSIIRRAIDSCPNEEVRRNSAVIAEDIAQEISRQLDDIEENQVEAGSQAPDDLINEIINSAIQRAIGSFTSRKKSGISKSTFSYVQDDVRPPSVGGGTSMSGDFSQAQTQTRSKISRSAMVNMLAGDDEDRADTETQTLAQAHQHGVCPCNDPQCIKFQNYQWGNFPQMPPSCCTPFIGQPPQTIVFCSGCPCPQKQKNVATASVQNEFEDNTKDVPRSASAYYD